MDLGSTPELHNIGLTRRRHQDGEYHSLDVDFAGSLQIAFLVALIAIAQTLRRSIGIWSPFWIVIFFSLQSLGEYANPFLMDG